MESHGDDDWCQNDCDVMWGMIVGVQSDKSDFGVQVDHNIGPVWLRGETGIDDRIVSSMSTETLVVTRTYR